MAGVGAESISAPYYFGRIWNPPLRWWSSMIPWIMSMELLWNQVFFI